MDAFSPFLLFIYLFRRTQQAHNSTSIRDVARAKRARARQRYISICVVVDRRRRSLLTSAASPVGNRRSGRSATRLPLHGDDNSAATSYIHSSSSSRSRQGFLYTVAYRDARKRKKTNGREALSLSLVESSRFSLSRRPSAARVVCPHGLIDARTAPLTTPSLRRRVSILRGGRTLHYTRVTEKPRTDDNNPGGESPVF